MKGAAMRWAPVRVSGCHHRDCSTSTAPCCQEATVEVTPLSIKIVLTERAGHSTLLRGVSQERDIYVNMGVMWDLVPG
jgi:hypothetical protein